MAKQARKSRWNYDNCECNPAAEGRPWLKQEQACDYCGDLYLSCFEHRLIGSYSAAIVCSVDCHDAAEHEAMEEDGANV